MVNVHCFMSANHNIKCLVKNLTAAVIGCAAAVASLVLGSPENITGPLPPALQQPLVIPVQSPLWPAGPVLQGCSSSQRPQSFFSTANIYWLYGWMGSCGSLVSKGPSCFRFTAEVRGLYDATILVPCEPAELTFSLDMDSRYASTPPG